MTFYCLQLCLHLCHGHTNFEWRHHTNWSWTKGEWVYCLPCLICAKISSYMMYLFIMLSLKGNKNTVQPLVQSWLATWTLLVDPPHPHCSIDCIFKWTGNVWILSLTCPFLHRTIGLGEQKNQLAMYGLKLEELFIYPSKRHTIFFYSHAFAIQMFYLENCSNFSISWSLVVILYNLTSFQSPSFR